MTQPQADGEDEEAEYYEKEAEKPEIDHGAQENTEFGFSGSRNQPDAGQGQQGSDY